MSQSSLVSSEFLMQSEAGVYQLDLDPPSPPLKRGGTESVLSPPQVEKNPNTQIPP